METRKTDKSALIEWILLEIQKLPPGTKLPSDRALSKEWGLSSRTIGRVLLSLSDEGHLVRVVGKGTFTPPSEKSNEVFTPTLKTSQLVVEHLLQLIANGQFQLGDLLPSVKQLSYSFRVSKTVASETLSRLEELGLVTRVGNRRIVGRSEELVREKNGRVIYIINTVEQLRNGSLGAVFSWDKMDSAFSRLEHEINRHGFLLRYENFSKVPDLVRRWESGDFVAGLMFAPVRRQVEPEVVRCVNKIRRNPKIHEPSIVILSQDGSSPPRGILKFNYGHVHTIQARMFAEFLLKKQYRYCYLFVPSSSEGKLHSHLPLKAFFEAKQLNIRIDIRIGAFEAQNPQPLSVMLEGAKGAAQKLYGEKLGLRVFAEFAESCKEFKSSEKLNVPFQDKSIWAFDSVSHMRSILSHPEILRQKRKSGFNHHIICLQDDRSLQAEGITCLKPDWEITGYNLAHALMGTQSIARSSRGFLRANACVLERASTLS